mmetsp:Transcript_18001/g.27213  ORF Transcript_18001/g.27213 Transcript_18001/m.27213 type:complete len:414 (-) Transcript_18001:12-1253(-)
MSYFGKTILSKNFVIFIFLCYLCSVEGLRNVPSYNSNNVVDVSISKQIPQISPTEVQEAWLDYTWCQGGGLPLLVQLSKKNRQKRTLIPLFAEEILLEDESNIKYFTQDYKLSELGPIWKSEIEPDCHLGTVSFLPNNNNDGTELLWNVTFRTQQRHALWQAVTEQSIDQACNSLVSYLVEPIKYTQTMKLRRRRKGANTNIPLTEIFVDFVWKQGGGLPLPLPPLALDSKGYDRLLIPPFLREQILSVQEDSLVYTVRNPSFFVGYPVHSHLGRIHFVDDDPNNDDSTVTVIWEVSVRPYYNCEAYVKAFTRGIVQTVGWNFKKHIEVDDNDQLVEIATTPIKAQDSSSSNSWSFSIRGDSWIGRVIYANQKDHRPIVLDQAFDLLQPWKWGVLPEEKDDVTYSWTVGDIDL